MMTIKNVNLIIMNSLCCVLHWLLKSHNIIIITKTNYIQFGLSWLINMKGRFTDIRLHLVFKIKNGIQKIKLLANVNLILK